MSDVWAHIGRVMTVNAARRQLRVQVAPDCDGEFSNRERLWLIVSQRPPIPVRVFAIRQSGAYMTVELTPGISRDAVAGFGNADVAVPASERRRGNDASPTLRDLPGVRLITHEGVFVGRVTEFRDTPGGGLLRLQCENAAMATAPAVAAFIERIDMEAGIAVVNAPEAFVVLDEDAALPDGKPSRQAKQDVP